MMSRAPARNIGIRFMSTVIVITAGVVLFASVVLATESMMTEQLPVYEVSRFGCLICHTDGDDPSGGGPIPRSRRLRQSWRYGERRDRPGA